MSSKGKRFIASLFGIRLSEKPPQMQSLVPQRIANKITAGTLPKFNPSTLMLNVNETCHFMDKAALAIQKKERQYYSTRQGSSYKLTKSYTRRFGSGTTRPLDQIWYEYQEGVIFVTNQRIIFVAQENGFEKKIKNLTAVIPYTDALSLQFGSQTITVMLPQSSLMYMVLQMVH